MEFLHSKYLRFNVMLTSRVIILQLLSTLLDAYIYIICVEYKSRAPWIMWWLICKQKQATPFSLRFITGKLLR